MVTYSATFRIDQVQGGSTSTGEEGIARIDLWQSGRVDLTPTNAPPGATYQWTFLDIPSDLPDYPSPPDDAHFLDPDTGLEDSTVPNPYFTPERWGAYLVELSINSGQYKSQKILGVSCDASGNQLYSGFMPPAWGETPDAANYPHFRTGYNDTGYKDRFYTLFQRSGGAPAGAAGFGGFIYVDQEKGDNSTGTRGNASLPFATVTAGLAVAVSGDIVYVAPGSYKEDIILPDYIAELTIQGCGEFTIISSDRGMDEVITTPTVHVYTKLTIRDMTIDSTSATYALYLYGVASTERIRVENVRVRSDASLSLSVGCTSELLLDNCILEDTVVYNVSEFTARNISADLRIVSTVSGDPFPTGTAAFNSYLFACNLQALTVDGVCQIYLRGGQVGDVALYLVTETDDGTTYTGSFTSCSSMGNVNAEFEQPSEGANVSRLILDGATMGSLTATINTGTDPVFVSLRNATVLGSMGFYGAFIKDIRGLSVDPYQISRYNDLGVPNRDIKDESPFWTPLRGYAIPVNGYDYCTQAASSSTITMYRDDTEEIVPGDPIRVFDKEGTEYNDGSNRLSGYEALTGVEDLVDSGGHLYFEVTAGDTNVLNIYNRSAMTAASLVGSAEYVATGSVNIDEENNSGLGGSITVDALGVANLYVCFYKWFVAYAVTDSLLSLSGPPISTGAGNISRVWVGDRTRVVSILFNVPGAYAAGSPLLTSYLKQHPFWVNPKARFCSFRAMTNTIGAALTVNLTLGGSATCTDAGGLSLPDTSWHATGGGNIDPKVTLTMPTTAIDITCAGGDGTAADLTLGAYFVLE